MDAIYSAPLLVFFVIAALFLGGIVKGTVGLGLPLVVVSLLGSALDPRVSVALVTIPVIVTNVWQCLRAGVFVGAIRRFWPLIATFVVSTWLGAYILVSINADLLLGVLGLMVVVFSLFSLVKVNFELKAGQERFVGPGIGVIAGIFNGISTVNGPPLVMYLMSLKLDKEVFVGSYSLIALCGSFPLFFSYIGVGLLGFEEAAASVLAVGPALMGLMLGERLRHRINPELFRKVLLLVLIILGVNLIRRGLM